jgi:hypothetical protein
MPPTPGRHPTTARPRDRAADALLNTLAVLGELVEDFKTADRFFKYKALVLALWLASAVGAFGVACPSTAAHNNIDARLIVGGEPAAPIYMVKNASDEVWQDVEIVVNARYRSTMAQLEPEGSLTISSAVIFDATGNRAPSGLEVTEIEVHIGEPEGSALLLKEGAIQNE